MYASIADLRAEGVTETAATDARLLALIDAATRTIDRVAGWFFEPRTLTLRLDGRNTPSLEPPVPPIRITRLALDGRDLSLASEDLVVVGAPVGTRFTAPRLTRTHRRVFRHGEGNVIAEGQWGFTEEDGTVEGRTPLAIRRAAMLLVLRDLAPLTDDASFEARQRARLVEEHTRDQSYRLDGPLKSPVLLVGDPEIDTLLAEYVRPRGLGAA